MDRTKKPRNAQEKKDEMEKGIEKKAREDAEAAERIARTVATAFGMMGRTERTRATPYPETDARKAMVTIGKGKLAFHVRAVHREIEQYNETRSEKKETSQTSGQDYG